jgi:site-specific DNA-methyltransferase (adenine-specific)
VIEMLNCDCMAYMAGLPDNAFDLAIVDPPYGIGDRLSDGGGKLKNTPMAVLYRESSKWDTAPTKEYFDELFRVSKNQIIWGGNYFDLPPSRCMICWDKAQDMPTLSAWELGWTSFDKPSKIYRQSSTDLNRFHPTQKPVALYKWLLSRYAKPGDRILDTHGGSGSICIACHDLGYDLTWMELDADYYKAACKRYQNHAAQASLFDPVELTKETAANELFD